MARGNIAIKKVDTLFDELDRLHQAIRDRVYDLFRNGGNHLCEFGPGKIFRSIHFPEKIDPESAKAELKNGMLHVTAAISKVAEAKKVDIKAA